MTENERKSMMILADTIEGEINRMCVTKELSELDTMYGHAKRNLDKLSKMIYDGRFKAEGMTRKEAAGVIKFEKACILRQDTTQCHRDCKKCDLLLPTEDVLTAYDMAIKALEQTSNGLDV